MRRSIALALTITAAAGAATQLATGTATAATTADTQSAYVQAVLKDNPSALLQGLNDVTGKTAAGTAISAPATTTLPNGDTARAFNGKGQYLQFADNKAFEIDNTGVLTVEYWMRPDALEFSDTEGSGYVYTLGKGNGNAHEYYGRMYSKTNQENRPNRISGYSFNPAGGLGAGSFFQDTVKTGEWIHVALVINAKDKTSAYPMGYTKIYKNGVLRDTDSLKDYNITPKSGTAPFRVGTGYLNSFFQGAVGDIAFYNTELSAAQLVAHNKAMFATGPVTPPTTPTVPPTTPTVPPTTPTVPPVSTVTVQHAINGTNTARATNQLVNYTPAKGKTTGTNAYGFEATVVGGKVTIVKNGVGNMAIPTNGYVISGHGTSRDWLLANVKVGATVSVSGSTLSVTK